MHSSINASSLFNFVVLFTLSMLISTVCHAKSIQDILKPSQNTFDWLDKLEALDSLESDEPINHADKKRLRQQDSLSSESQEWIKTQTKALRLFSTIQISDHFSMKPGKIKSKPLKLSDISAYYALESIGEQNEPSGSKKAYGLKFHYDFK